MSPSLPSILTVRTTSPSTLDRARAVIRRRLADALVAAADHPPRPDFVPD